MNTSKERRNTRGSGILKKANLNREEVPIVMRKMVGRTALRTLPTIAVTGKIWGRERKISEIYP